MSDPDRLWALSLAVAVAGLTVIWISVRVMTRHDDDRPEAS